MPRYVAFLRGVSPMNAKMPELARCFEGSGFTEVKTVLSSGNLVFNWRGPLPRPHSSAKRKRRWLKSSGASSTRSCDR